MVKTKTSTSSSASIVDFIDPIQYTMKLGPSADAGPDQTRCTEGDSTAFALQGQATAGLYPLVSTNWSVVSGTATIDSTNTLVTTAHVFSPTATLRLTVAQANGCIETDEVVLTVNAAAGLFDHRPDFGLPAVQRAIPGASRDGCLCLVGHGQRVNFRAGECPDRDGGRRDRVRNEFHAEPGGDQQQLPGHRHDRGDGERHDPADPHSAGGQGAGMPGRSPDQRDGRGHGAGRLRQGDRQLQRFDYQRMRRDEGDCAHLDRHAICAATPPAPCRRSPCGTPRRRR